MHTTARSLPQLREGQLWGPEGNSKESQLLGASRLRPALPTTFTTLPAPPTPATGRLWVWGIP